MGKRAFGIRRVGNLDRWDGMRADAMAEDEAREITRQLLDRGESMGTLADAAGVLDRALGELELEPCAQGGARSHRRLGRW